MQDAGVAPLGEPPVAKTHPQLHWHKKQLYQTLALNCKGEALALIKSFAATQFEKTRGITAWWRLTRDHRGSSAQRIMGLAMRVFHPTRVSKMSETLHLEVWEAPHKNDFFMRCPRHNSCCTVFGGCAAGV